MTDYGKKNREEKKLRKAYKSFQKRNKKLFNLYVFLKTNNLLTDETEKEFLRIYEKRNVSEEEFKNNRGFLFEKLGTIQTKMGQILSGYVREKIRKTLESFYAEEFIDNVMDWEIDYSVKRFKESVYGGEADESGFLKCLPVYCPICGDFNPSVSSDFLSNVFKDNYYAYIDAVLVTHYRHEHIKYYDRSWRYSKYREKNKEYKNYDDFKKIVNNRAKRKLIRAMAKDKNLKENFKTALIENFRVLQFNDEKTEELITKTLKKLKKGKK